MTWLAGDGREMRSALLGLGLQLEHGTMARGALARLMGGAPDAKALCVGRLGWQDRAYVLPDAIHGDTGGQRVVWQPDAATDHAYRVAGTLEGWRCSVNVHAAK